MHFLSASTRIGSVGVPIILHATRTSTDTAGHYKCNMMYAPGTKCPLTLPSLLSAASAWSSYRLRHSRRLSFQSPAEERESLILTEHLKCSKYYRRTVCVLILVRLRREGRIGGHL